MECVGPLINRLCPRSAAFFLNRKSKSCLTDDRLPIIWSNVTQSVPRDTATSKPLDLFTTNPSALSWSPCGPRHGMLYLHSVDLRTILKVKFENGQQGNTEQFWRGRNQATYKKQSDSKCHPCVTIFQSNNA